MTDTAQLTIFISEVDSSLNATEEMLDMKSMHGTTTREERSFDNAYRSITHVNLPWSKPVWLQEMEHRRCAAKKGGIAEKCG